MESYQVFIVVCDGAEPEVFGRADNAQLYADKNNGKVIEKEINNKL